MKIVISGASGLIGTRLKESLEREGHNATVLVRDQKQLGNGTIYWDPETHTIDKEKLEGVDAIVNLSGEGIASGFWTESKKKKILDSRVNATSTLAKAIASLKQPPKVLINGSAIGFYGDRGDAVCDETTSPGNGFLADVCVKWEGAAAPAINAGIRTAFLRTGIVLAKEGGALGKMLLPFKLGLGGVIGSGEQYMSWIALDDLVGIIRFILSHDTLKGAINGVSPHPATNREFTKALGSVLNRPTVLPVPAFALKALLGKEMAEEFLLGSTRVEPKKLLDAGYRFKYPDLKEALRSSLNS